MSQTNGSSQPLDRLRKNKRPNSVRVGIVMDSRYQEAVDDAQRALSEAQLKKLTLGERADPAVTSDLADAHRRLERARAAALEHTEWFIAKGMSPNQYDALLASHAPTGDQKDEARREGKVAPYNQDTFPAALVSACVCLVDVDPDTGDEQHCPLTDEFVKEMQDGGDDSQWTQGEFGALFGAAVAATQSTPQRVAQLGNG